MGLNCQWCHGKLSLTEIAQTDTCSVCQPLHAPYIRIAIVGSRLCVPREAVQIFVQQLCYEGKWQLVSGGAKGVDSYATDTARQVGVPVTEFIPNWEKDPYRAGNTRNTDIIGACDILVAFQYCGSSGTQDSIIKAKEAGKPVYVTSELDYWAFSREDLNALGKHLSGHNSQ